MGAPERSAAPLRDVRHRRERMGRADEESHIVVLIRARNRSKGLDDQHRESREEKRQCFSLRSFTVGNPLEDVLGLP